MNIATRLNLSLHRVTGTIIAIFFMMWFVTGLVLIYHDFPRLSDREVYSHMDVLPDSIAVPAGLPQGLESLALKQFQGQTLVSYSTADTTAVQTLSGLAAAPVDFSTAMAVARKWGDAPISRVDTLHERDQWIMYSRYKREMPIYKFHFDNSERSQLYVASRSAKPLQLTDRTSRAWAWAGAIPHKLYLPCIRGDVDRWKFWITVGALFCLVASVTGLIAALVAWRRVHRATGRWKNPYKKRLLRIHFTFGLIFAIPLIAWSISGYFSMQRVPRWLVPMHGDYFMDYDTMWGEGMLNLEVYKLDVEKVREAFPDLKSLSFTRFGTQPVYEAVTGDTLRRLDASTGKVKPLLISESTIMEGLRRMHGDSVAISLEKLNSYDSHYYSVMGRSPLPVYRAKIGDSDGTLYYIDPRDGHVSFLNHNKLWRKYLFSGIHYLNLRCFAGHEFWWQICLWIVCVAGGVYCFLSCILGVKYIRRMLIRGRKRR